jgi:hypothetical protein
MYGTSVTTAIPVDDLDWGCPALMILVEDVLL